MQPFRKKVFGTLSAIVASSFSMAIAMSSYIGLSTTPDDAAALGKKLPPLINWLMHTPWWVAVLLWIVAFGFVVWAFWPDRAYVDEIASARDESKKSLQKAWEFRDDYENYKAAQLIESTKLDATLTKLLEEINFLKEAIKENIEGLAQLMSAQSAITMSICDIHRRFSDIENERGKQKQELTSFTDSYKRQVTDIAFKHKFELELKVDELHKRLDDLGISESQ